MHINKGILACGFGAWFFWASAQDSERSPNLEVMSAVTSSNISIWPAFNLPLADLLAKPLEPSLH